MIGPGKYDDICTEIRERLGAQGVVLVVLNGTRGHGVSQQVMAKPETVKPLMAALAGMLNEVASGLVKTGEDIARPKHSA
jgi:hypothetical protein